METENIIIQKEPLRSEYEAGGIQFSESCSKILKALFKAQQENLEIEAKGFNSNFQSAGNSGRYVKVQDTLNTSYAALKSHGLMPLFSEVKSNVTVYGDKTTYTALYELKVIDTESGEWVSIRSTGIKTDKKDITLYSATSLVKKYLMKNLMNLQMEEDPELEDNDSSMKNKIKTGSIKEMKAPMVKKASNPINITSLKEISENKTKKIEEKNESLKEQIDTEKKEKKLESTKEEPIKKTEQVEKTLTEKAEKVFETPVLSEEILNTVLLMKEQIKKDANKFFKFIDKIKNSKNEEVQKNQKYIISLLERDVLPF